MSDQEKPGLGPAARRALTGLAPSCAAAVARSGGMGGCAVQWGVESGAWLTQFVGERLEEGLFRDSVPGDMEASTPSHVRVNGDNCAAVVFQQRVPMSEGSEDLAGFLAHGAGVAAHVEAVLDGAPHVSGMGEEIECAALAHGEFWRERRSVLPGPWINRAEDDAVGCQHMLVAEHGLGFQMFEGGQNIRGEGMMLEVLDGLGLFLAREVAR